MLQDSVLGYGLITILLHWSCALLTVVLFGLGIYMVGLDYYAEWYYRAPALHISFGLVLAMLMPAFMLWRAGKSIPEALPSYSHGMVWLAGLVKYSLYVLIFAELASGYLITTAAGKPASLFGIVHLPAVMKLEPIEVDWLGMVHELLAWAIVTIAGLHALAALAHHFILGDRTLVRMLKPVRGAAPDLR